MSLSLGPSLISCIRQNEKYNFRGLSDIHGGGNHFEFQSLARDLSIPWHHIYYAEQTAGKSGKGDLSLLRWFIIHLLHQSASGHLRTDLNSLEEDLEKWCQLDREYFPGSDEEFAERQDKALEIRGALMGTYEEIVGVNPGLFGSADSVSPFVYHKERQIIYIRKFYKMEKRLLASLDDLAAVESTDPRLEEQIDRIMEVLKAQGLPSLSEKTGETVKKLLAKRFAILSGGPGTGKTTTVTALLRILKVLENDDDSYSVGRICLAAPTGRAANRMIESMRAEMKRHPIDDIDALLPGKAYTLHKLLGINPATRRILYSRERPIPAELIILDEASMVDARMMSLLFDALAPGCSLLLVGDRDQLPSVDAGAVFGDFVAGAESSGHKLHEGSVFLTKSWRSSSGILEAAGAVISGDASKTIAVLNGAQEDLSFGDLPVRDQLVELILQKYGLNHKGAVRGMNHEKLFALYERFAVLIPTRRGPYGVESLNRIINLKLSGRDQSLYHGQPVMILNNDYNLSLFNGDRGVIVREGGDYFALFRDGPTDFRKIPAGKLGSYETSYCQTVHKSQGSEFDSVLLLIPEGSDRLLTREIVYTGITRAKNHLTLLCSEDVLRDALSRVVVRHSGIREYLGGAE